MRARKIDNSIENKIVTGAIVSTEYLKSVRMIYNADLIAVPFVKTVMQWCLDYYAQYEHAPERHIADIFEAKRRNGLPEEQANLIEDFLAGLSDEYEHAEAGKFNAQYLLDQTEQRFEARNQELLLLDIQALHSKSDYKAAEELLRNYKRVQRPNGQGIEPLTNKEAIERAFSDEEQYILFRLPGILGELVGPIVREDFIGILAPEKRGKSITMLDMAMRALRPGCNVAYFDAGDSSETEITQRIHIRNSRQSHKNYGVLKSPVLDCAHNQDDTCNKRERTARRGVLEDARTAEGKIIKKKQPYESVQGYTPCTYCEKHNSKEFKGAVWYELIDAKRLTADRAYELGKRTAERTRKRFKLSCHPNNTLSVRGIEAVLDAWEQTDNFVADVVIVDYADILIADDTKIHEERHRQNNIWKALRRVSQQRHCAVITATQADADSYDRKSLKESNFSEDKRKYSHVTKFLTLNQTPEEKDEMIMRIGMMFARNSKWDIRRQAAVMQNLDLAQVYCGSYWA